MYIRDIRLLSWKLLARGNSSEGTAEGWGGAGVGSYEGWEEGY